MIGLHGQLARYAHCVHHIISSAFRARNALMIRPPPAATSEPFFEHLPQEFLQVPLYSPSICHLHHHVESAGSTSSARSNLWDVKVLRQAAQMGIQLVHPLAMRVLDGFIDPLIAAFLAG